MCGFQGESICQTNCSTEVVVLLLILGPSSKLGPLAAVFDIMHQKRFLILGYVRLEAKRASGWPKFVSFFNVLGNETADAFSYSSSW